MKIGTKSILFGVHQFLWHPITVGLAWHKLFRVWPTWREWVCIFVHDLGYWGKPNIDGLSGKCHPILGAEIARELLGVEYGDLTLYHSRDFSRAHYRTPSRLAWADKWSIWIEPTWLYMVRGKLSGEIREFKTNAPEHVQRESDEYWYQWYRTKVRNINEIRALLNR